MTTQPAALASLREIARSLSAAVDLDTTLDLIAQKTTELMRVNSCTIYLLDPDGETLRLRATTGLRHQILGYATLRVGEGMTGAAVARNEPVFARVAQQHPDFKLIDAQREETFRSLLAIPLLIQDRPIGALNVQTIRPREFHSDEIETLSLIGELAAGALAKAQLYDAQKTQLDELRALADVSEIVTSPQYLDDMLDIVTDMAAQTMNAGVCSLFLLDETGSQLELRSAKRVSVPYSHRHPLRMGEGIVGWVASTGERMYVPNILAEPRFANPDLAREEGLSSMLAVPLSVREHVIGVMACYTNEPRSFTDKQIALFSTLANQTALAIENARLVTNAAIVREMHHRIKNNLQMVAMLMQLQIPDAEHVETRTVLDANIHRIHSIAAVHEVLSEKGFHLVDVRDVLVRIARATVEAVNAPQRTILIDVQGESLALPSRVATALALVVNELVQNAVEHAFADRERGHVVVSLGRSPTEIIVGVRDDGVGMPEELEPGLGLEIAQTLVGDDLQGNIDFGRRHIGTEVTIRMPRVLERE